MSRRGGGHIDMSTHGGSGKVRTFVLISDIPTTVTAHAVRDCLRDQTTGFMKLVLLDEGDLVPPHRNKGYGLALYDSRGSAVEAMDAGVVLTVPPGAEGAADGGTSASAAPREVALRLQAVQHQEAHTVEATYRDTVSIEGEPVKKAALAATRGLQAALSGAPGATPRWCNQTRAGADCPRGDACRFIHKAEFQRTTAASRAAVPGQRRNRDGEDDGASTFREDASAGTAAAAPASSVMASSSSASAAAAAAAVVSGLQDAVPLMFRPAAAFVNVPLAAARALANAPQDGQGDTDLSALAAAIDRAIESDLRQQRAFPSTGVTHYFVRLDERHGAPLDAPFVVPERRGALRAALPERPPAFITPLDRDAYLHAVLKAARGAGQLGVQNGAEAVKLLASSPRVRDAAASAIERLAGGGSTTEAALASASSQSSSTSAAAVTRIAVLPFYETAPAPFGVVDVFFKDGEVYGAAQHEADVLARVERTAPVTASGSGASGADADNALAPAAAASSSTAGLEAAVATAVHRFAMSTRLHLAQQANAAARGVGALSSSDWVLRASRSGGPGLCVTVAVQHPGRGAVAVGVHELPERAAANSLFPAQPLPAGEVRWRTQKSVFTPHLPAELRDALTL